jgi:cation diffusion facilitator family transporter
MLEVLLMHTVSIERWMHEHTFGQEERKSGEQRTLIVIVITAVTMMVEIAAGIAFGSMALLADGLHMGSHASALGISGFAYYYARRRARDVRFNFGTGKVNSLAAFASAVMLLLFALIMAGESLKRFASPVSIQFNWAIFVAVAGLVVNGACLVILGGHGHSHDEHEHGQGEPDHHQEHAHGRGEEKGRVARPGQPHISEREDQNLWSAYVHVLADALTSLLAIFALLGGKFLGQVWLDPFMGVVGAVLVVRWSSGLIRSSAHVLLDMRAPDEIRESIKRTIEEEVDNRVSDLHVWAVGPGIYAAEVALIASDPKDPDHYCDLLPHGLPLVHVTVEVHNCPSATGDGLEAGGAPREWREDGGTPRVGVGDAGPPDAGGELRAAGGPEEGEGLRHPGRRADGDS